MGRHRFEEKDKDKWGGPELAEKRQNATHHSRDNDGNTPVTTPDPEEARPDADKV